MKFLEGTFCPQLLVKCRWVRCILRGKRRALLSHEAVQFEKLLVVCWRSCHHDLYRAEQHSPFLLLKKVNSQWAILVSYSLYWRAKPNSSSHQILPLKSKNKNICNPLENGNKKPWPWQEDRSQDRLTGHWNNKQISATQNVSRQM